MKWWFTARRPLMLAQAVAAYLAFLVVLGGAELPLPSILDPGAASTPLSVFLPILLIAALQRSQDEVDHVVEATAVRPLWLLRLVLPCGLLTVAIVSALVVAAATGGDQLMAGRNFVGYLGIALLAYRWLGSRAMTVAVLVVAGLAGPLGARQFGEPEIWAFPLHRPGSLPAAGICGVLLALGLAQSMRKPSLRQLGI